MESARPKSDTALQDDVSTPTDPAPANGQLKGPASLWWESHPASMPSSTVLWNEDDPVESEGGAANLPF